MKVTRKANKAKGLCKIVSFDTISEVQTYFQSKGWAWTEERDQHLQAKGYVKYRGIVHAWTGYGFVYQ